MTPDPVVQFGDDMTRAILLERFEAIKMGLSTLPIDDVIIQHLETMLDNYSRKPFFYKNLLKYDRLMVVLTLFSSYYADDAVPLSAVRDLCKARRYLSKNSLDAYFSFFIISGYMKISGHPDDRRLRAYEPSHLALLEAARVIDAYLLPSGWRDSGAGGGASLTMDEQRVARFFKGFAQLLEHDLTLEVHSPEARWMMNKDGGHLLMLAIHVDAQCAVTSPGGFKASSYARLSSRLGVSSMHMIRLVREGESAGYFRRCGPLVEVTPAFTHMVRNTVLNSMALMHLSMELGG